MTATDLQAFTRKELAQMAREDQVAGWHTMRKDELVQALASRHGTETPAKSPSGLKYGQALACHHAPPAESSTGRPGAPGSLRTVAGRNRLQAAEATTNDQLCAEALDPRWIHVRWRLTTARLRRAEVSLGGEWYRAVPVLRLYDVTATDDASPARTWLGDTELHGAGDHWYVPVNDSERSYRLCIGYRTPSGKFFELAQSDVVRMPHLESAGPMNGVRSNGPHTDRSLLVRRFAPLTQFASLAAADFRFELEAELLVRGSTHPEAELTLFDEPVPLAADGSFSLRFALPDGRQVIPAVAVAPYGGEQRTIVLAIERNTRHLEPQLRDDPDE